MALDTRGFMHGFTQSFGMMDNHYTNQANRELARQRADMEQQKFGLQKEEHEQLSKIRGAEFERKQGQWNEEDDKKTIQQFFNDTKALDAETALSNNQERLRQLNDPSRLPPEVQQALQQGNPILEQGRALQEQIKQRQASALESLLTTGEADPELLKDAPSGLFIAGTPEMEQALNSVDQQFEMLQQGGSLQATPEFIGAMNLLYDNHLGEGKRITGIYPGKQPGTVVFELEVDDGTGNMRRAPLTVNRGTEAEGDNEIKQVPIEKIIDSLQGAKALHTAVKFDPEARERINRFGVAHGYIQPQEKWIPAGNNAAGQPLIQNSLTGEVKAVGAATSSDMQAMMLASRMGQPIYESSADPTTGQGINRNRITGKSDSFGSAQAPDLQKLNVAAQLGLPWYSDPEELGDGRIMQTDLNNKATYSNPPASDSRRDNLLTNNAEGAFQELRKSLADLHKTRVDGIGQPANLPPEQIALTERAHLRNFGLMVFGDLGEYTEFAGEALHRMAIMQGDVTPELQRKVLQMTMDYAEQERQKEAAHQAEQKTIPPPAPPESAQQQGLTFGRMRDGVQSFFGLGQNQNQYSKFDPRNVPDI